MNKILKNTLILTAITLVAGLLLGVVYEITKNPIAKAEEAAKQTAYKEVLADASEFVAYDKFDEKEAAKVLKDAGITADIVNEVVVAKDSSGQDAGYVVTVTSKEGYGGDIQISTGIGADGTVTGVSVLSISETAGLGMKSDTPEFKGQFKDKKVDAFKYTKSGAKEDGEIDALSGATITTNAFVNDVNAALVYYQNVLAEGGSN